MSADKNKIIQDHIPFIIKTVSDLTGRYVTLDDDEMSIALLAFNEAIDKYDNTKGAFLAFARLVIRSRLLTYLQTEQVSHQILSLEVLKEAGIEVHSSWTNPMVKDNQRLKEDLAELKNQMVRFGFDFEILASEGPKHRDTRVKAIQLSKQIIKNQIIILKLYEKLRLPIRLVCTQYQVTEKFVKGSKRFIITVIIILDKELKTLLPWIEGR